MMGDGLLWKPASTKETAYYDKVFEAIVLDKSGTLDGQEAVKFLSLSGLTKPQLKDVCSLAISPGGSTLQRNDFYVAMRAVALAQSGEDTLTPQRVRETATKAITMATFKGWAKPPIKSSKGKKENQENSKWFSITTFAPGSNKSKESKWFSKTTPATGSNKGAAPTIPPTSGLPKAEDGAGRPRAGKGTATSSARSTKSEQKGVQTSKKDTNNESRRL